MLSSVVRQAMLLCFLLFAPAGVSVAGAPAQQHKSPIVDGEGGLGCAQPEQTPPLPTPWRWVSEADFHPVIPRLEAQVNALHGGRRVVPSMTCTFGEADFNGDQKTDLVGLAVHGISGAGRLLMVLSGDVAPRVLAEFPPIEGGGIYTSLSLKLPGEAGILGRDSPSLEIDRKGEGAARLKAAAGVKLCRPIRADTAGRPEPTDTDNVCFCTEQFFFTKESGFSSATVCD